MRILMTSFPAEGHLQPLLPMARAARDAGHDLVVATGPDLAPAVERRGFRVWPAGPTMAAAFAAGGQVPAPRTDDRFVLAGTVVFVPAARRLAADVLARAPQWRPDLVLSEALEPAGLFVAARTGARYVAHGLGPLPLPSHWQDVPALAGLCEEWGLPEPFGGLLHATFLDICPPALQIRAHVPTSRVRPLRPAGGDTGAAPELAAALDALPYDRTVHLTLGTIVRQPAVYEAALAGLRELPVNVVVSVGSDVDPAYLGPQPRHVLLERYAPHEALLPRCDLLVSHAGAATMLAGYRHGLPQLFLPRGADQFDNAAAGVAAGAALSLPAPDVDPAEVATQAGRLLEEPQFAAAARTVRAQLDAMPPAEQVLADLVAEHERERVGARG